LPAALDRIYRKVEEVEEVEKVEKVEFFLTTDGHRFTQMVDG